MLGSNMEARILDPGFGGVTNSAQKKKPNRNGKVGVTKKNENVVSPTAARKSL